ncbi:dihydrolipoyl dehydrogenase [Amorphus orientalis]|uniref:Dihydrolipoamide dehydrogenase n=1 Tax=Amorphus orientalis TaxID=649198 RepID=A0AAE4ART0_9HYPH|nr:dihydrolipoyl dehydrogenase [Amorphus orientalis]MDQ0314517.1 dihydrolipoamide dehydrogenase [Amorphus orientalis]
MSHHDCDVAVIGAGTAGLAAERSARRAGARTLLIDDAFAGTLCASRGCMPSKLLIAAAHAAHAVRTAHEFGIAPGGIAIDGKAVMARVQAERDKFVEATRESISQIPDGICIKARARFTGPTVLALDNGDTVSAKAIVIATGSFPMVPGPFRDLGDLLLTNQTVFEQDGLPDSLAVVGAGPLGVELAQAMARLGVRTALFDQKETAGGATHPDVQKAVHQRLDEDLSLHLGVDLSAERSGDRARLTWTGPETGSDEFDRVLVATGRPPALGGLNLEATGLQLDDHGVPEFDRATLQCGDSPIFLAGDCDADAPVLHEAANEGRIAGSNAAAHPDVKSSERTPCFTITFVDPPLATIGAPPGDDSLVGAASYTDQGRAKVENRAVGLVRIYADPQDGRLTGAELFAPGADHMAHLLAQAVMHGETASGLLELPFYHPTLEEGLKPALREICRNTPSGAPPGGDDDDPPGA